MPQGRRSQASQGPAAPGSTTGTGKRGPPRGPGGGGRPAASGELFLDELAYGGAVRASRDLVHDPCHDASHVADVRSADLGDDVVDDLLDLLFGERLGHGLLENLELLLLVFCLLLPPAGSERLGGLEPALALALEHLQLLVVGKRPLKLLLCGLKRVEDQAERGAGILVASETCRLELLLDPLDETHAVASSARAIRSLSGRPPRTCQWRWKIVWPAP